MKSDEYKSDWRSFVNERLIRRDLYDSRTGYELVMEGRYIFSSTFTSGTATNTLSAAMFPLLKRLSGYLTSRNNLSSTADISADEICDEETSLKPIQPWNLSSIKYLVRRLGYDRVNYTM